MTTVVQGTPVVVSGTPVSNPHAAPAPAFGAALDTPPPGAVGGGEGAPLNPPTNVNQGSKQEVRCRDPLFALLFYVNIIAIAAVAAIYGGPALTSKSSNQFTQAFSSEYATYYYSLVITGFIGLVLSGLGLQVMMCIPEFLIKVSLIFSVVVSALWVAYSFYIWNILSIIISLISFAIMCCYACCIWSRIPWATVNLVTAITAVKSNCGITVTAFTMTFFAAGWTLVWGIAMLGVFDTTYNCDANGQNCNPNYGYLFLCFCSYFFGHQVVQNSVHVTVAGVVGTWWLAPDEAKSCCSSAVTDSIKRTLTTSFGSICFGSLLAAIVQALRMLVHTARQQDDGILLCLAECLLACLQSIIEYFNKWAFIYVGLYGYSYIEAGKNVFALFQNRGWEAIIGDDLVGMTLFFVSVVVGAITGGLGAALEHFSGWYQNTGGSNQVSAADAALMAFLLGFIAGLVLCSILMSVVGSGVNAVIVLFADKPQEFQQNYPELSSRMRQTWAQIYPGSV